MKSCKSVNSSFAVSACNNGRTTEWISIKSDTGKLKKKNRIFPVWVKLRQKIIPILWEDILHPRAHLKLSSQNIHAKKKF